MTRLAAVIPVIAALAAPAVAQRVLETPGIGLAVVGWWHG